ncbi:hypothetical protein WQQ_29160 [Hydrocarboniphaga effusa AP103]|uniref:Uncharacterized protein n=1 Tax=Hydrocarboniphaga effusa AP103 TaxID=1172194 RepID=I7ZBS4_9GAMM|nr:hypothetical protein WQQ_29160 [Hydrocarboniphaga effusa AP103]
MTIARDIAFFLSPTCGRESRVAGSEGAHVGQWASFEVCSLTRRCRATLTRTRERGQQGSLE